MTKGVLGITALTILTELVQVAQLRCKASKRKLLGS